MIPNRLYALLALMLSTSCEMPAVRHGGSPSALVLPAELHVDIALALVRGAERRSLVIGQSDVALRSDRLLPAPGTSIESLLSDVGFLVDAESMGLVFCLNPHMRSGVDLHPKQVLVLPHIIGGAGLRQALDQGFRIEVTLDSALKVRLFALRQSYKSVWPELLQPKVDHSRECAGASDELRRSLESIDEHISVFAQVVAERARPLGPALLRQVVAEMEILLAALSRTPGGAIDTLVTLVEQDLRAKAAGLATPRGPNEPMPRWPEAWLRVRTLRQTAEGRIEVGGLRVRYAPIAIADKEEFQEELDTLSSPAEGSVPEGDYLLWASSPASKVALSERRQLKARAWRAAPGAMMDLLILTPREAGP